MNVRVDNGEKMIRVRAISTGPSSGDYYYARYPDLFSIGSRNDRDLICIIRVLQR